MRVKSKDGKPSYLGKYTESKFIGDWDELHEASYKMHACEIDWQELADALESFLKVAPRLLKAYGQYKEHSQYAYCNPSYHGEVPKGLQSLFDVCMNVSGWLPQLEFDLHRIQDAKKVADYWKMSGEYGKQKRIKEWYDAHSKAVWQPGYDKAAWVASLITHTIPGKEVRYVAIS